MRPDCRVGDDAIRRAAILKRAVREPWGVLGEGAPLQSNRQNIERPETAIAKPRKTTTEGCPCGTQKRESSRRGVKRRPASG